METKTVTGPGGRGHLWVRLKGRRPVEAASPRKAAKKTTKTAAAKKTTKKTTKKAARKAAGKTQEPDGST